MRPLIFSPKLPHNQPFHIHSFSTKTHAGKPKRHPSTTHRNPRTSLQTNPSRFNHPSPSKRRRTNPSSNNNNNTPHQTTQHANTTNRFSKNQALNKLIQSIPIFLKNTIGLITGLLIVPAYLSLILLQDTPEPFDT